MVDKEARKKLAELLRHVASGTITHDEFRAAAHRKTKDKAIKKALWLYWDLAEEAFSWQDGEPTEYRFTGDAKLTERQRLDVARMVMLLLSDTEYKENYFPSVTKLRWWQIVLLTPLMCVGLIFAAAVVASLLVTLGPLLTVCVCYAAFFAIFLVYAEVHRRRAGPVLRVWPFKTRSEYEEALKHPLLLCGKNAEQSVDAGLR